MCIIAGSGARLPTAKRVKGFLELSDVSVGEFEQASSTRVTSIYSRDTDTHGLLVESSVRLNLGHSSGPCISTISAAVGMESFFIHRHECQQRDAVRVYGTALGQNISFEKAKRMIYSRDREALLCEILDAVNQHYTVLVAVKVAIGVHIAVAIAETTDAIGGRYCYVRNVCGKASGQASGVSSELGRDDDDYMEISRTGSNGYRRGNCRRNGKVSKSIGSGGDMKRTTVGHGKRAFNYITFERSYSLSASGLSNEMLVRSCSTDEELRQVLMKEHPEHSVICRVERCANKGNIEFQGSNR
ncbi:hypothetical protein P5673_021035 [Acropora cervicornis]|uniref:Uncharacterized protein n=1 Tax=Acropora cervicornis TaxID=6130 RepID=A0AAD9Q8R7_ACRCE|nr:hypothetical protein P5673_021035 [Acropora cervicornis]